MSRDDIIPHLNIVVAASAVAALGYFGFSLWVVLWSGDVALKGDVIGTWKSFAVAAFAFWLGSSSAGKSKAASTPQEVTGPDGGPVETTPAKPAKK